MTTGELEAGSAQETAERRALVPVLIFIGTVVAVISSLGAPLIPSIARTEGITLPDAQWALTVTLLVGAVATPVVGRLGDGPRRRAVMLAVLGVVVVGSALAALPLGFGWLIAGRGLQGFGLGLTPLAIATARDALLGPRQRGTMAALSVTVAAGVGLGYPISGLIAQLGGVHAAFAFGGIVAALALVAGAVVLPPSPDVPARRLDLLGAVLLGLGLASGLLALDEGGRAGWTSARLIVLAVVCVVALAAWAAWALRARTPLVDLRLARGRTAVTAHVAALLIGLANYLLLSGVPLLAQTPRSTGYGFGAPAVVAGLLLLPFSVGSVVGGRLAPMISDRWSPRALLPLGASVLGVAMLLFGLERGSLWTICGEMLVAGLGVGTTFAGLPALVVASVPRSETGSAMSLNQVLRYSGFSIGSATTATTLAAATPPGAAEATSSGYTALAVIGLVTCFVMAVLTWALPSRTATPSS